MSKVTHEGGRPYGMGRRDWRLMNKSPTGTLANKVAAVKFEADIKEHGLTLAMQRAGIEDDGT